MDFDDATPEVLSSATAEEIGRETSYAPAPVETDGAARAAALIAELL